MSSFLQPAALQPLDEHRLPSLVVRARGQLRHVVHRCVRLDARDLPEVVHRVRAVGGAAAHAEKEQPAAPRAQGRKHGSHPIDQIRIQRRDDLRGLVEMLPRVRLRRVCRKMTPGFLEPGGRADFVEATGHLAGRQPAVRNQILINGRQVERAIRGITGERARLQRAEPVVDVMHRGRPVHLVVPHDPSVGELHVALVPAIVVLEHSHQAVAAARQKRGGHRLVVAFQVRVAVEHQERLAQERHRLAQRAASAERPLAVARIPHAQAVRRPVADGGLHALAKMPEAEDHVRNAARLEQLELARRKRLARHVHERLRCVSGGLAQPRRQPARKNRDRQAHETSTFVPSKSNRNRTSSSPALRIAVRTGCGRSA